MVGSGFHNISKPYASPAHQSPVGVNNIFIAETKKILSYNYTNLQQVQNLLMLSGHKNCYCKILVQEIQLT